MIWYNKEYNIENRNVVLTGSFNQSKISIDASIEKSDGSFEDFSLYEKPINMWAYQEIFPEDILRKYQGMVLKCEKRLPTLVEKVKVGESI